MRYFRGSITGRYPRFFNIYLSDDIVRINFSEYCRRPVGDASTTVEKSRLLLGFSSQGLG